ncbi:pentapeptide repeat-containing protein [Lyngbya confervoides]|uniref:Pentapeptide repeat-containing protein n=1 Tax=Lyngbya confervoides BDU141951 TaxID=1574623 RepID=A0ABD4T182_9CYAN|nr:pentapeptide repeat-containing protein [Lyngbya confervoides]MCM1982355.1 pentapeptide repeat-containing protein [Lyngbya confervoides BDU141951]
MNDPHASVPESDSTSSAAVPGQSGSQEISNLEPGQIVEPLDSRRSRPLPLDFQSVDARLDPPPVIDEARLAPDWGGFQGVALGAAGVALLGILLHNPWIGFPAIALSLGVTLRAMWNPAQYILVTWIPRRYRQFLIPVAILVLGVAGAAYLLTLTLPGNFGLGPINWDAFGALAELFGAVGQIMVAFLALYVAWRQYVISKELTTQQNRITQQQTIDTYFQGISDLVLDDEGLLEDWPPERAIAEGRTASILVGLNAEGKAKVIRFLSSAKLLTPLKRDRRLGRPIFNGLGGYEEDIEYGVRVIDLGSMLASGDLTDTDLRNTDLSDANLVNAKLDRCELTRANLARTILYGASLRGADLSRVRLFYGTATQALPRDRIHPPNYVTGAYTGAVVENADLTGVKNLSEEQRYYCCAWGGVHTRASIPGGCEGIPNRLLDS